MTDPFSDYIDSSVKQVLDSAAYMNLTGDEREKLTNELKTHFENLIFETFLNRLTDEQVNELKGNISKTNLLEDKFTEYAAQIPELATDIEDRLGREIEALKSLAQ